MARLLRIATSQYPVSSLVTENFKFIQKQIKSALFSKADLVHFPECALSGYGGIDFDKYEAKQQIEIEYAITKIKSLAKNNSIWIVFGTHSFVKKQDNPFNSLFVINPKGEIEIRYDKRLLSEFDLNWYSAGNLPGVFEINGIKCGLLICHEWRYPELYRQYYHLGVEILFQSWYDGNYTEEEYKKEGKNLGEVIPGFVRGNAANNKFWVSAANTSKKQSSFPAFVCRPDGLVTGRLKRNVTGLLISEIDVDGDFMDLSAHLRDKVNRMLLTGNKLVQL